MKRTLVLILCFAPAACSPSAESLATQPVSVEPATTPTGTPETPFFGGGPELPGRLPDQIKSLLEAGINLPITDCVASPETGGNRDQWDNWINTLVENGASRTAIADLQAAINAKLKTWGISGSTSLELCAGGDGGWSFAVRDNSSGLFWWSYDLKNQRFADRPDRVFNDRDWQFKPMPRQGLKSGLEVEFMMVNGWPLAVAINPEGRPIQYFDPVLGEFINFYPDTPTPTRTATAVPTITNTPRPTAIPATAVPRPSSTLTLEPSPTTPTLGELPCDNTAAGRCAARMCIINTGTDRWGNTEDHLGETYVFIDMDYSREYIQMLIDLQIARLGPCP